MNQAIFNFVCQNHNEGELLNWSHANVDENPDMFALGPNCWSLQTYLFLKERGLPVICSEGYRRDRINLVHYVTLRLLSPSHSEFVVCLRGDYPSCPWAAAHVVQNRRQECDRAFWVPLWPQPGLVPRGHGRTAIENVAFAGRPYYLAHGRNRWSERLRAEGMNFTLMDRGNWSDYSKTDILVAIRSFDGYPYDKKPPTKLINAWLAGIPLVAGHDSAFKQIGRPGEDYLVVDTFEHAVETILRLREDGALYTSIVRRGRERAKEFTRKAIGDHWQRLLFERIVPLYEQWLNRTVWDRSWSQTVVAYDKGINFSKRVYRNIFGTPGLRR